MTVSAKDYWTDPRQRQLHANWFGVMLLVIFGVLSPASCRKDANSKPSSSSSTIEISGTVKEDEPTDFVQSDESVQIGGVNLTASNSYKIAVTTLGGLALLTSQSDTTQFKLKFSVPVNDYIMIRLTRNDGKQFAIPLPPPHGASFTAKTIVDGSSTIASKILEIAVEKAAAGDASAVTSITSKILAIHEIFQIAKSIYTTVEQQKASGVKVDAINMSVITAAMISEANKKAESQQGKIATEVSKIISYAAYVTMFSTIAETVAPSILAYRVNDGFDPASAYRSLIAAKAISPITDLVVAAYQVIEPAYRKPPTPEDAAAAGKATESQYASIYNNCVTGGATLTAVGTCSSPDYTPSTPPDPPPSDPQNPSSGTDSGGGDDSGSGPAGSGIGEAPQSESSF